MADFLQENPVLSFLSSILKTKAFSTQHPLSACDSGLFREGMSRVAGAVHIVTTQGEAGLAGFTATAVTPVTDEPASLLVCINKSGQSAPAILGNGFFCVNTLAADDRALAETFAGRTERRGLERFALGTWEKLATGAPALTSSIVSFDCKVADARIVASHHVIIGEVVTLRLGQPRQALIYHGRLYHTFEGVLGDSA